MFGQELAAKLSTVLDDGLTNDSPPPLSGIIGAAFCLEVGQERDDGAQTN